MDDLNFEEYGDIMNQSLDTLLISLEYKILNKIYTEDEMIILKCVNSNGHKIYIINDLNLPSAKNGCVFKGKIETDNSIPYSLKMGSYNTIDNTCSGILLESSNGLITLINRGDDLNPIEKSYSLLENSNGKKYNSIIIYPILKISDIIENAEGMLKYTDKNIASIKNDQLELQVTNLQEMYFDIIEIHDKFEEFNSIREEVIEKLKNVMIKINVWNNLCRNSQPITDEDKNKCNIVRKNIEMRNDEVTDILKIMEKVSSKRSKIKSIIAELDLSVSAIKEYLEIADKILIQ